MRHSVGPRGASAPRPWNAVRWDRRRTTGRDSVDAELARQKRTRTPRFRRRMLGRRRLRRRFVAPIRCRHVFDSNVRGLGRGGCLIKAQLCQCPPAPCGTGGCSQPCGHMACPSSEAFIAENAIMHTGMAIRFTCDANLDFVRGMVRTRGWICFVLPLFSPRVAVFFILWCCPPSRPTSEVRFAVFGCCSSISDPAPRWSRRHV